MKAGIVLFEKLLTLDSYDLTYIQSDHVVKF